MPETVYKTRCTNCNASVRVQHDSLRDYRKCPRCKETFQIQSIREFVSKSPRNPLALSLPGGRMVWGLATGALGIVFLICTGWLTSAIFSTVGGSPSEPRMNEWYDGLERGMTITQVVVHLESMPDYGPVATRHLRLLPYTGESGVTSSEKSTSHDGESDLLYIDGELVSAKSKLVVDGIEYTTHAVSSRPNPIHDPPGTRCYESTTKGGEIVIDQETFIDEIGSNIRELRWSFQVSSKGDASREDRKLRLVFQQQSGSRHPTLVTISQQGW